MNCCSLSADARDSIAKVAYGRVFGWIVCKINELLAENVDPQVELSEIGEFCTPCSLYFHSKGKTSCEISDRLFAGIHYQRRDHVGVTS